MKRIDFLGAAGTGKSTLYHALLTSKQSNKTHPSVFLTPAVACQTACSNHMRSKGISNRLRLYWYTRFLRSIVCNKVEEAAAKLSMRDYVECNQGFIAAAHKAFALGGRSETRRAEGYYYFITILRRLAFLDQWAGDVTVIYDESLSQKVYALMPWDRRNEEFVRNYFEHMPPPTALVHLDAITELVVQRIRKREQEAGTLILAHQSLDEDELWQQVDASLHFARIGAEVLSRRGIPVLSLDTAVDASENAGQVHAFVKELV